MEQISQTTTSLSQLGQVTEMLQHSLPSIHAACGVLTILDRNQTSFAETHLLQEIYLCSVIFA